MSMLGTLVSSHEDKTDDNTVVVQPITALRVWLCEDDEAQQICYDTV